MIGRYWYAIRQVFPETFDNPQANVIQKTPGVFPLHQLTSEVFELTRDRGKLSVENLYSVVKAWEVIDDGSYFWDASIMDGAVRYGSMKGFRILESQLRHFLPELKAN